MTFLFFFHTITHDALCHKLNNTVFLQELVFVRCRIKRVWIINHKSKFETQPRLSGSFTWKSVYQNTKCKKTQTVQYLRKWIHRRKLCLSMPHIVRLCYISWNYSWLEEPCRLKRRLRIPPWTTLLNDCVCAPLLRGPFLQYPHTRHHIIRRVRSGMGCLF